MNEFQKVLASIPSPEPGDVERDQHIARVTESREVLQKLPEYVRGGKLADLAARVPARPLLDAALAWGTRRERSGSLVLMGPSRTGKSTAAAVLFRRIVSMGVRQGGDLWARASHIAWFAASDLEAASKEHGYGKGEAPALYEASHASVLFLDDAGWDANPRPVSEVLGTRYERGLPTIVTTGKDKAELQAHYSGAVVRRILESGGPGLSHIEDVFPTKRPANAG